jgi:D-serine dehydratase
MTPLILDHRTKGIPGLAAPFPASEIAAKKWNALAGDVPLPFAILKQSAMERNSRWIMEFVRRTGVSLCPHGKTTMCPQIFHRLAD